MLPHGYADLGYQCRVGRSSSSRTTKVTCGRSTFEAMLGNALYARGLEFPDGSLAIDEGIGEISLARGFAFSEAGPSVSYTRLYPRQDGSRKMMEIVERMLRKEGIDQSEAFRPLCHVFKDYLVENLGFTEKAVFSSDARSKAWIQGTVEFTRLAEIGAPEEHAEYSMGLTDPFVEEISETYRLRSGKDLSARQQEILANKKELLSIDAFLRAVEIRSSSHTRESTSAQKNLYKCTLFLMDTTLGQAV